MLKPQAPNKVSAVAKLKLISTFVSIVMRHPRLISGMMCILKLRKVDIAEKISYNYDKNSRNGSWEVMRRAHGYPAADAYEGIVRQRNTDYERRYGFRDIKLIEGSCQRLPISTYDDYAPLVALMTRLGESNAFTSDRLVYYNLSFGPDVSARLIPCTRSYIKLFDSQLAQMLRIGKGRVFSLCTCLPAKQRFNDGAYMNTISGALLNECSGIKMRGHGKDTNPFTSPPEMLRPSGLYDQRYVRALFALAREDVKRIYAPYAGIANNFLAFLRKNCESLVKDVDSGIIGSHGELSIEFQLPEALRALN